MQFEDFDKKIRDAADHHHPAYQDKAWPAMKDLLDKHLPEEEKNRRRGFLFFLLLFLLLGGGTWLLIDQPWKATTATSANHAESTDVVTLPNENSGIADKTKREKIEVPPNGTSTPGSTENSVVKEDAVNTDNIQPGQATVEPASGQPTLNNKTTGVPVSQSSNKSLPTVNKQTKKTTIAAQSAPFAGVSKITPKNSADSKKPVATTSKDPVDSKPVTATDSKTITSTTDNKTVPNNTTLPNQLPSQKPAIDPVNTTVTDPATATDKKAEEPTAPVIAKNNKKNSKSKFANGLAFTLSGGADVSSIGVKDFGALRPVYGFGLSYTFANRFTLRTGFYAGNKVYTASPTEYKFSNPPPNRTYLIKIDADCKVYEIPLNLAYTFNRSKQHSWFGALGLSSYIMKEEKYDYVYKYPNGSINSYPWDYKDKNKHILSVLSVSGGYTRKLTNTFSISGEPFVKIPFSGIGVGKLKLNSMGVMITASAKLTGKKK